MPIPVELQQKYASAVGALDSAHRYLDTDAVPLTHQKEITLDIAGVMPYSHPIIGVEYAGWQKKQTAYSVYRPRNKKEFWSALAYFGDQVPNKFKQVRMSDQIIPFDRFFVDPELRPGQDLFRDIADTSLKQVQAHRFFGQSQKRTLPLMLPLVVSSDPYYQEKSRQGSVIYGPAFPRDRRLYVINYDMKLLDEDTRATIRKKNNAGSSIICLADASIEIGPYQDRRGGKRQDLYSGPLNEKVTITLKVTEGSWTLHPGWHLQTKSVAQDYQFQA